MRKELELMELIENYLNNKLSEADKVNFEKRLSTDTSLQEAVALQSKLIKGIERASLKQSAGKALKKYTLRKNLKNWGLSGLTVTIITLGALFLFTDVLKPASSINAIQPLPELNENGEKLWSDADKYLALQSFEINADRDTVVETKEGIVFAIPAHSFLTSDGKPVSGMIQLEVKEALKAADMLKGGLSTKSGDQLLETGGMFYLNARQDKQSLQIDPNNALRAQIPTNEVKPGMQLYEGKRMPDGTIDWINPKPLEKDLIPVDILSLNFYPPHYLDSLRDWQYNHADKKFTDSLYYSFSANILSESSLQKAQRIFNQNCVVCHSMGENKITGPGLRGVTYRAPGGNWLRDYIKNNEKVIKSGDAYARKISTFDASQMTIFESTLSDEEIDLLVDYLKWNDKNYTPRIVYDSTSERDFEKPVNYQSHTKTVNGIDPAKIKAIWDTHYQHTLLSTKEFEERLAYLHETCLEPILDLYVNHLDKNLCTVDSLAANSREAGSPVRSKFLEFAARGDGNVKNGNKNVALLTRYYQEKSKLYKEAITKIQDEFWKKQKQLDEHATAKKMAHAERELERVIDNTTMEIDVNLKEAYRQLGGKKQIPPAYGAIITSTGWNNVDRAVIESVIARTTLDYTDPATGKKAVIEYLPLSVSIADYKNYDRVLVYLLPDEFNSFMRLQNANATFSEKVTKLMLYKLICVAYKGEESFYYSQDNIKPGSLTVSLIETKYDVIQNNISQLSKLNQVKAMNDELNYMAFDRQEQKRQAQLVKLKELTEKIRPVIFPCARTRALGADTAKYY